MFRAGVTRTDICAKTGLSMPTVRKVLAQNGTPPRDMRERTAITDEIRTRVVELYNQLHSAGRVAEQVGINKRTVLNIVSEEIYDIRPKGREVVSAELFIKAWQETEWTEDTARILGLSVRQVHARAHTLRTKGIPLRKHLRPATYTKRDWSELADLADLYYSKDEED